MTSSNAPLASPFAERHPQQEAAINGVQAHVSRRALTYLPSGLGLGKLEDTSRRREHTFELLSYPSVVASTRGKPSEVAWPGSWFARCPTPVKGSRG